MYNTPILLLIFNRPDCTARVMQELRSLQPAKLFVAADGPRANRAGEEELCQQARDVVLSQIDWPCELRTNFLAHNLGCKRAVSSGISWFFNQVEAGVILEDDTVPDQSFFRYCTELLEVYKDDARIGMISADNFQASQYKCRDSYYFSLYTHIWGWATWRRAWKQYDLEMQTWPQLRDRGWLFELHQNEAVAHYWSVLFERMHLGQIDTWDYAWTFSCWKHNMLTVLPCTNLVSNIGFRADATHTTLETRLANLETIAMQFPLRHPAVVARDVSADRRSEVNVFEVPGLQIETQIFEHDMETQEQNTTFAKIDQALELLRTGNPQQALEVLSTTTQALQDLHHVRAMCHVELGNINDARREIDNELKLFPNNQHASELLSIIQRENNQTSSHAGLQQVTESTPNLNVSELITRATDALERNQFDTCLDALAHISLIDDKIQGLYLLKSVALERSGKLTQALEAACEELRRDPANDNARHVCGAIATKITTLRKPCPNPEQRSEKSNLEPAALASINAAVKRSHYQGYHFTKGPFDLALYSKLLWEVKPSTVVLVGDKAYGDALWIADQLQSMAIEGQVIWLGTNIPGVTLHPRLKNLSTSQKSVDQLIDFDSLAKPLVLVANSELDDRATAAFLKLAHKAAAAGEYIIVEGGTQQTLDDFFAQHPGEYDVDSEFTDCYGYNFTSATNGYLRKKRFALNPLVPKEEIRAFNIDDPAPQGIESQMSINERFQLFSAIMRFLPKRAGTLKFIEIGSHAGASLLLVARALKRSGRPLMGYAVEPQGTEQFYQVLQQLGTEINHLKMFSHPAAQQLSQLFASDRQLADFILVDGDHTLAGVRQDVVDYYPLLAPGGLMIFHDYLPAINDSNRAAIHFHHAGWEPGIRQACQELVEQEYHCEVLDLPLLYPEDPTQTQPHLPVIPGVFSTLRAYRKPL